MRKLKTLLNICALFIITLLIQVPAQAQSPECLAAKEAFNAAHATFKMTLGELLAAKKAAIKQAVADQKAGLITSAEKEELINTAVALFEESKIAAEALKDEAEALKDTLCGDDEDDV